MLREINRTEAERFRRKLAADAKRALRHARQQLGPALAYGRHILWDTVTGEKARVALCCRRMGTGWLPTPEESFGAMLDEHRTDNSFKMRGETVFYRRYQVTWGILEDYNPTPQSVLDERRARRKAKRAEAERQRALAKLPLFRDDISKAEG